MKIGLRAIIAALGAIVALAVASVSVAMMYTSALTAMNAIVRNHAIGLAVPVQVRTEQYVQQAVDHSLSLRRAFRDTGYMLPVDDDASGAWVRKWTVPLRDALLNANSTYAFVRVAFADDSSAMAYYEPRFPGRVGLYATDGRTIVAGTGATRYKEVYDIRNGNFFRVTDPTDPVVATYADTSASRNTQYSQAMALTSNGAVTTTVVNPLAVFDFQFSGSPVLGVLFNTALHNATDFMGMLSVVVTLDQLNGFVQSIKATPGTVAFILDNTNYVLASSDPKMPTVWFNASMSAATAVPTGCVSTAATQFTTSTTVTWACRHPATSFGAYAPLASLTATHPLLTATAPVTLTVTMPSGAVYYVSSTVVGASALQNSRLKLLVFIPENDVLSNIVLGRNIAIGSSAGVFVIFVGTIVALVYYLLSPLHDISVRMRFAASLNDEEREKEHHSRLKEVAEIEHSYYALNTQLNAVRHFMPQSVMFSRDDEEEGEVDEEDEGSARVTVEEPSEGDRSSRHSDRSSKHTASRRGSTMGGSAQAAPVNASARSQKYLEAGSTRQAAVAASGRSARHIPIKQLNFHTSLTPSRCSILALDMRGFHQYMKDLQSVDLLISNIGKTVAKMNSIINEQKGILDFFQGDHFMYSFAAVRPAAAHAKRATLCALRIAEEVGRISLFGLDVCAGVSSGMALVGNVGCNEGMRFNVVGALVTQACLLSRMCRLYDATCLVPSVVLPDLETHVNTTVVDVVRLPGTQRPCAIAKAVEELNKGEEQNEEWLYIVGGNVNASEQRNKAFDDLAKGDDAAARELVAKWKEEAGVDDHDPAIDKLTELLSKPDAERHTNLGRYYEAWVPRAAIPPGGEPSAA